MSSVNDWYPGVAGFGMAAHAHPSRTTVDLLVDDSQRLMLVLLRDLHCIAVQCIALQCSARVRE